MFDNPKAGVIIVSGDAIIPDVLGALCKLVFSYKFIKVLVIHYNGHGEVQVIPELVTDCGRFICANKQELPIEYILEICNEKAYIQDCPMTVWLFLDECGAEGVYHRICKKLNDGSL